MPLMLASFTNAQINLIVAVALIFAVLFVGNSVLLWVLLYRRKKRKLCTAALQQRREQLLEELAQLRYMQPKAAEEEDDEVDDLDEEDEVGEDEVEDEEDSGETAATYAEILAVRDMSALMRQNFGFTGAEFDRKRYYVRYAYSFEAKLCASTDEVKTLYSRLMDEVGRYKSLKVSRSFRRERVYAGRKTLAMLVFRGKTLCMAFALDPADYADTKYRGKDMAQIKRYAATPMLIKITSARKLNYVKYLIAQIARLSDIAADNDGYKGKYRLGAQTLKALYSRDSVKIAILGEAPELEEDAEILPDGEEDEIAASDGRFRLSILPVSEMSPLMRKHFGFEGEAYDGKRYYVRYLYGFDAKLRSASEELKARYSDLVDETGRYRRMRVACGFRQQRIYYGRKTVGLILFKGKTLCVALALNPRQYENSKYRGIDMSEVKRFEKTPMLIKLTSERRVGYAKYLLNRIAEEHAISMNATPVRLDYSVDELSRDELFANDMLKIVVIGEVPDSVQ